MIGWRDNMARFAALLHRFGAAREGVAAVEFALILPFMLALYVGSIELSDLINVDRRITVIAGTVGDLVSREKGTLTETEMTDYFTAAEEIITPYSTTGLKQIVTCVKISSTGVATVEWSRASGGATAKTAGAVMTLPTAITNISKNGYIIVSETGYSYKPLMGIIFTTAVNLYRQNFHLPRFNDKISIVAG
jgi:Flp pilus assembly protein TadG